MKIYICKKCITYGGKDPCILSCENDLKPTHCPHDDSKYPNSQWEELSANSTKSHIEANAYACKFEISCTAHQQGYCSLINCPKFERTA